MHQGYISVVNGAGGSPDWNQFHTAVKPLLDYGLLDFWIIFGDVTQTAFCNVH